MGIEVFYVLDFDRCLGKTEKLQELLEKAVEKEDVVSLEMIQYAHGEVKKTGGSFDTAAYVRQVLKDRQLDVNHIWGKIEASFMELAKSEDLLEPGARLLLEELGRRSIPFGILTYGGFEWQTAKLRAAGLLDVPHIITSYKEKSRTIAGWRREGGGFMIPKELKEDTVARSIILIDDRPVSFAGITDGVKGICVAPQATKQEVDALSASVTVVPDLAGAMKNLFIFDKT